VSWRTKAGELRPKGRELDASIQPVSAKVDSRKLGEDKARFPRMSLLGSWVNRASPLESARKARPGYGPPDRVIGSQTLEALVEAN
jgi:hypothetical protein